MENSLKCHFGVFCGIWALRILDLALQSLRILRENQRKIPSKLRIFPLSKTLQGYGYINFPAAGNAVPKYIWAWIIFFPEVETFSASGRDRPPWRKQRAWTENPVARTRHASPNAKQKSALQRLTAQSAAQADKCGAPAFLCLAKKQAGLTASILLLYAQNSTYFDSTMSDFGLF